MRESPNRPRSVTGLTLFVLIFTGSHWLRFAVALRDWRLLQDLPLSVPSLYFPLSGAAWGLLGLGLAYGLFRGAQWSPRAARWLSLTFALYVWLDREFLRAGELAEVNRGFALAGTLVLLSYTFWTLSRPGAKAFFGEPYER